MIYLILGTIFCFAGLWLMISNMRLFGLILVFIGGAFINKWHRKNKELK